MAAGSAGTGRKAGDGVVAASTPPHRDDVPQLLSPRSGRVPLLQRLAELAAAVLRSPGGLVSLLGNGAGAVRLVHATTISEVADSLGWATTAVGRPLIVTDVRTDAGVREVPGVASGDVAAYLGVPLTSEDGHVVGALSVFDPAPRDWSATDVLLLQQLAAFASAQLELDALARDYAATRTRWELAIDAAGIGGFDWDLTTGRLTWDERLIRLFGYEPDTFNQSIDAFYARLHPDDLPRVTSALQEAIASCGRYEAEYRVVRPDGGTRWIEARGLAIGDENGTAVRVLGAAYDTTEVHEGEARVARVLESMSAAFFSLDREWRFSYVNAEGERLLGRAREELLGGVIWELFPAAVGSDFEAHYRRAMDTGEPVTFEAHYPEPLNAWYEVRAWPAPDGLSVYFLDITARRAAQEQAERAANRAGLLAKVASELSGTLEAEVAVARLSRLVVPALADWCVVTLVDEDAPGPSWRRLRDIGCWHREPGLRPLVERYASLRLAALTENSLVARALTTGRGVVVTEGATDAIASVLEPGEARGLLTVLGPESAAVLPLRAHGLTLGLLTLFWNGRRRAQPDEALDIAMDVAVRAGLALDNARLYARQRRLAEGLQRSLLTDPPEPDHLQIVVRYEPAAEASQVGGDWYDAFLQPDGATVLVIGDVVGHDVEAAAAMGQVRGLLRGIAAATGDGPAGVLSRLDAAMELLQLGTTATAVVARFEQSPDERERGITRLRWSNAGHPPPIVVNPDGTVTVLGGLAGVDADLLLGIDPRASRVESEIVLDRGATVLLYTDGLVERRGQSIDEGLVKLRDTLAALGDRSLDETCDEVLSRMLPAQSDDDVALAAVRLHPQHEPRPAEAGPNRVPELVDGPEAE